MIEAYPLSWPAGRKRIEVRQESRFGNKQYGAQSLTVGKAIVKLNECLSRLGAKQVVISTNVPTRNDGLPYASAKEPEDPGVAVYFMHKGRQKAFSCDKYRKLKDNIWAIALTIEAIRGIERWGTGEMVDAAFSGFDALPSPETVSHRMWWEVLDVEKGASTEAVSSAYRRLASVHHPDRGGSTDRFIEIQRAWEEYRKGAA